MHRAPALLPVLAAMVVVVVVVVAIVAAKVVTMAIVPAIAYHSDASTLHVRAGSDGSSEPLMQDLSA
jgi:hypothetical protein